MIHRFDVYAQVHKGIRLALSGLCYQAGSVDSSDEESLQSFMKEFGRVVIILEAHSRDEDTHLNELYEKYAPETLRELEEEHGTLEQRLEQLVELAKQLEISGPNSDERQRIWYQIGKDLNRFTADYLIHLQREEGPGMKALWENLSDKQLKVVSQNIRSSIPPHAMAIFMHYMIPAISHQDRVEMFREMKQFAPKEAFAGMMGLAESRLGQTDWARLQIAL